MQCDADRKSKDPLGTRASCLLQGLEALVPRLFHASEGVPTLVPSVGLQVVVHDGAGSILSSSALVRR